MARSLKHREDLALHRDLPSRNAVFCCALFLSCLLFAYPPSPSFAHIDEASMPDAVAKMEYLILLEFEPDNIDVRNKLAMVFLRLGKPQEAAEQFEAVLQRAPANFNAIDGMGLVLSGQKKYEEALVQFDKAITIDPSDAMVHYHRGRALEALDQLQAAAEGYEKALSQLAAAAASAKTEKWKKEVADALQSLRSRLTADAFTR